MSGEGLSPGRLWTARLAWLAMAAVILLLLAVMSGLFGTGPDRAMEDEAAQGIADAREFAGYQAKYGAAKGSAMLPGRHTAPRRFQGDPVVCAAAPVQGRAMLIGGTRIDEARFNAAWFDYVWRRAGC